MLHIVCAAGHEKALEMLLAKKADINITDDAGNTPLHSAAFNNQPEIVARLLKANADMSQINLEGHTPAIVAAGVGFKECAKQLQSDQYAHEYLTTKLMGQFLEISGNIPLSNGFNIRLEGARAEIMFETFAHHIAVFLNSEKGLTDTETQIFEQIMEAYEQAILDANANSNQRELQGIVNRIQKGELVVLRTGWKTHSVVLVFYQGRMLICNRGSSSFGKNIVPVPVDLKKIKVSTIMDILDLERNGTTGGFLMTKFEGYQFVYSELIQKVTSSRADDLIASILRNVSLPKQIVRNCSFATCETAFYSISYLMSMTSAVEKTEKALEDVLNETHKQCYRFVVKIKTEMFLNYLNMLMSKKDILNHKLVLQTAMDKIDELFRQNTGNLSQHDVFLYESANEKFKILMKKN